MTVHLIKLCVGVSEVAHLVEEHERLAKKALKRNKPVEDSHWTRMFPKRADEVTGGGSLYWVIKGHVACRQRLLCVRPFTDGDGIGRCHLVLEPVVIPVAPRPCRPFQGWRYLEAKDAPRDLGRASGDLAVMPEIMRRELAELGLL